MLLYYSCYVKPTYAVFIPQFTKHKSKAPLCFSERSPNLAQNEHNGDVSKKASKNIKNAVNWMLASTKLKRVYRKSDNTHFFFRVAFFTLTLPSKQLHSDNEIKNKVLQPFVTYARNKWRMKNYVWRAEAQKNGNVHFHFTTDIFIHHSELNRIWNLQLLKLGYIGGKPSTEIHAVKNVNNLGAYLAKYLGKNDESRRKIIGKLWACSESLSVNNTKLVIDLQNPSEQFSKIKGQLKHLIVKDICIGDLMCYSEKDFKKDAGKEVLQMYNNKLFSIRNDVQEFHFDDLLE